MIDGKLAKGLVRQHISRAHPEMKGRHNAAVNAVLPAINRICSGHVLTDPTAAMNVWLRTLKNLGVERVVRADHYHAATAFVPAWIPTQIELASVFNSSEGHLEKIDDQDRFELLIYADYLELERKSATFGSTITPLILDRHAMQRWLERQPGADVASFEAGVVELLPLLPCFLANFDCTKQSFACALPLGDGLLLGVLAIRHSDANTSFFGTWQQRRHLKGLIQKPAIAVGGKITDNRNVAPCFNLSTFYGPHEMNDEFARARELLVDWKEKCNSELGLCWKWMSTCAIRNETVPFPVEMKQIQVELRSILASPPWVIVMEKAARSLRNSVQKRTERAPQR